MTGHGSLQAYHDGRPDKWNSPSLESKHTEALKRECLLGNRAPRELFLAVPSTPTANTLDLHPLAWDDLPKVYEFMRMNGFPYRVGFPGLATLSLVLKKSPEAQG